MMKFSAQSWLVIRMLACLLAGWQLTSCSKSSEARTRAEQVAAFQKCFGFAPPDNVTDIRYADDYQRGVVDGTYVQWLRCSFDEKLFEQIVARNGFKEGQSLLGTGPNKPAWWGSDVVSDYVRSGKDGASYVAHLRHDPRTGFIYWSQTWTD